MVRATKISIHTKGRGLHLISREVEKALALLIEPGDLGLVNLFLRHTSASLLIQENADPTAKRDLEEFIDRLVPEGESWHRHLDEGPDDTVSHMKAAILPVSLTIPVENGRLQLGTWQGLYVSEHRLAPHQRELVITAYVESQKR